MCSRMPGTRSVHGTADRTPVTIDRAAADGSPDGHSPDGLRARYEPVAFVRRFVESGKPVLTLCHAPRLRITAQVLPGRTSVAPDDQERRAEYIDREVVIDGNRVSSRRPDDIAAFIEA